MGNPIRRAAWTPILIVCLASTAWSQADPATTQRIIEEGKNHSQVMPMLRELVAIGPRLTSSTNLERAQAWAMAKMKGWGLQNVHLEKWGEYPVGFDRGRTSGRMILPDQRAFDIGPATPLARNLEFTAQSWTEGTHGTKRGPAVPAPATMEEFNDTKAKLKGAWVLYKSSPPRPPRLRPGETPPEPTAAQKAAQDLRAAINGAGILGTVYPSNNDLVITSGNYRDKTFEEHPRDVSVMVRKSDMELINKNLEAGHRVDLEFQLEHTFRKGPISNYNVVGDIPGTEKPDEVVIVSGHLDSWDGPGSQGALDNGTGSCTALEAARILAKVGAKPKRTIRFILWSGEEQGLFGSTGYVRDHKDDLDKISAVLVDDGGTDYQGGYNGIASQKEMLEAAFAPMNAAFPNMPEKFVTSERMPRGGGSDHAPFNAVGVPGFFTIETGRANYGYIHHTQHDRIEQAIPEYLVQSGTNHAVVSFYLACAPGLLPRQPATPAPPSQGR